MSAAQIEVVEARSFPSAVADEIVAVIEETLAERETCVVALSGGETPASVNRLLSLAPRVEAIEWSRVCLVLGDERWVSVDDPQSNAKMVHDTLLGALTHKPTFISVDTTLKNAQLAAEDYDRRVRAVLGEEGKLDLVLLGMGDDGHIASLFPNSPQANRGGPNVVVARNPVGQERISLSVDLLFSARKVVFLVKGAGKAAMVKRVIKGDQDPHSLPARFYTLAEGRVTWILDTSAAAQL